MAERITQGGGQWTAMLTDDDLMRSVRDLLAARDVLAAENARLREALKPILYALDDDGEMQDFRGGARDRLGKAIRAARALVEPRP